VEEAKKPAPATAEELVGLLDIRVGRVLKAWRHPEVDTLYVEEVDVGEEEPRIICSGLVSYLPSNSSRYNAYTAGYLICRDSPHNNPRPNSAVCLCFNTGIVDQF
jgi:hypothetical protein